MRRKLRPPSGTRLRASGGAERHGSGAETTQPPAMTMMAFEPENAGGFGETCHPRGCKPLSDEDPRELRECA